MGADTVTVLLGLAASAGVAAIATARGLRPGRRDPDPAPHEPERAAAVETSDPPAEPSVVEPPVVVLEPPVDPVPVQPPPVAPVVQNHDYDEPTCEVFVAGFSDDLLVRAQVLFEALARDSSITARELAAQLGVEPRQLPGLLITPLRRRSDQLGLPLPFEVSHAKGSKLRQWEDSGGVAARMTRAIARSAPTRTAHP